MLVIPSLTGYQQFSHNWHYSSSAASPRSEEGCMSDLQTGAQPRIHFLNYSAAANAEKAALAALP